MGRGNRKNISKVSGIKMRANKIEKPKIDSPYKAIHADGSVDEYTNLQKIEKPKIDS